MQKSHAHFLFWVLAGPLPAVEATNKYRTPRSCAFQTTAPRKRSVGKNPCRSTGIAWNRIKPARGRNRVSTTFPFLGANSVDEEGTSKANALSSPSSVFLDNPVRSITFSVLMVLCGAMLGPFLDSFHSAFGVLQYDDPITAQLWGRNAQHPALITAWWVPELFGLAGFIIGWLYIVLDGVFKTPQKPSQPSTPKILLGISFFTLQYWLSGVFVATDLMDRTGILYVMSVYAAVMFLALDRTMAGFITSAATALGGPLIEVGLLSLSRSGIMPGGYHYNDVGETGFFPLWIMPVYFLGGPAVGNLARGFWQSPERTNGETSRPPPECKVCNDTRCVECPNCDGLGMYTAMGGRSIHCSSCKGKGFVICRACFDYYGDDPDDIEAIRELMSKMPD